MIYQGLYRIGFDDGGSFTNFTARCISQVGTVISGWQILKQAAILVVCSVQGVFQGSGTSAAIEADDSGGIPGTAGNICGSDQKDEFRRIA